MKKLLLLSVILIIARVFAGGALAEDPARALSIGNELLYEVRPGAYETNIDGIRLILIMLEDGYCFEYRETAGRNSNAQNGFVYFQGKTAVMTDGTVLTGIAENALRYEYRDTTLVYTRCADIEGREDYLGKWELSGMVYDGVSYDSDRLREEGFQSEMTFYADGSLRVALLEDDVWNIGARSWRADPNGAVIFYNAYQDVPVALQGGELYVTYEDGIVIFTKA